MILKIIAYGFLILAFVLSVIALCGMCKVASDSDDQMERIFRMMVKDQNKGDEPEACDTSDCNTCFWLICTCDEGA